MGHILRAIISQKVLVDQTLCGECGACVAVCPPAAIELYPMLMVIKDKLCTECTLCTQMCPAGALAMVRAKTGTGTCKNLQLLV